MAGEGWHVDEPMSSLPPGPLAHSRPPSQNSTSLPPIVRASGHTSGVHTPNSQGGQPFRTFEPRSREERRVDADKTSKEKARIAQRHPNAEPPPGDIIVPNPQTSMYMDDHSRFIHRDAAALEHERKHLELQKKEAMYDRKRQEHFERETKNWESNQAYYERSEAVAKAKREAGEGGARRNRGGTSYNIVTLDYANTPGGDALKYQDSLLRYKANLRSNNLYSKNHSTGFNVITGAPAWKPAEVQKPTPAEHEQQ